MSLQLKASEPSLRRSVRPLGKPARPTEVMSPVIPIVEPISTPFVAEPDFKLAPPEDVVFDSFVGPVVEQDLITPPVDVTQTAEISMPSIEEFPEMSAPVEQTIPIPAVAAMAKEQVPQTAVEPEFEPIESAVASEFEPIGQGQPIPYQMSVAEIDSPTTPTTEIREPQPEHRASPLPGEIATGVAIAGVGALREPVETPSFVPEVVSTEPSIQLTTPATMPEPVQIPTAQVIRTPATGGAPQPASAMQTAVQLTFSFEIASMQLTPTFKMGALQLRPSSKIVTMRLAPSQHPQPAMNLQVTFEIAKIQPSGGGLGTVRLTPSQQQRPTAVGSSSFTVAGLQLVSNFEAAPVQLTPSQQASVLVTGSFQIATVEFSPSFEIASIVLNSSSKQVSVQLPGSAAVEGAPMFDIANLQLGASGDIGMMQLNLLGHGPRRA